MKNESMYSVNSDLSKVDTDISFAHNTRENKFEYKKFTTKNLMDKYKKNYAFIIDIDRNGTVSFPQKNKACFQLYDIRFQELKKYGEGCNEKRYMSPFPRGEFYRFETERSLLF